MKRFIYNIFNIRNKVSGIHYIFIRIFLALFAFSILPIVIIGVIWYNDLIEKNIDNTRKLELNNVNKVIDQISLEREALSKDILNLIYDKPIASYRATSNPEDILLVLKSMRYIQKKYSMVYSIYLYDTKNHRIYDSNQGVYEEESFYDTEWIKELEPSVSIKVLSTRLNVNTDSLDSTKKRENINAVRNVVSLITPESNGFKAVVNIDVVKLGDEIKSRFSTIDKDFFITSNSELFYTTLNNKQMDLLTDSDQWSILDGIYENLNDDYLCYAKSIDKTDLFYIESISIDSVINQTVEYRNYITKVILTLVIVIIVITIIMTDRVYRPFDNTIELINENNISLNSKSSKARWKGVKRAFRQIDDNKDGIEYKKNICLINAAMFKLLLGDTISQTYFLERMQDSYKIELVGYKAKILIFEFLDNSFDKNKDEIHKLNEVINYYLFEHKIGISTEVSSSSLGILIFHKEQDELVKIHQFVNKTINELMNEPVMCSSDAFDLSDPVNNHYSMCKVRLDNIIFFGKDNLKGTSCLSSDTKHKYSSVMKYATIIIKSIIIGDMQEITIKMNELEEELLLSCDKDYARNLCLRIIYEIDDELKMDSLSDKQNIVGEIYKINTLSALKKYMLLTFELNIKKLQSVDASLEQKYYEKALMYMQENYMNNIGINDVASSVGISYVYLNKIFNTHQTDGLKMIDYLNTIRIEKAIELLKQTNDSLTDIAEKVGYNNTQSLTRFFKKYRGQTPGAYRKRIE